jgi:hypothetical protein
LTDLFLEKRRYEADQGVKQHASGHDVGFGEESPDMKREKIAQNERERTVRPLPSLGRASASSLTQCALALILCLRRHPSWVVAHKSEAGESPHKTQPHYLGTEPAQRAPRALSKGRRGAESSPVTRSRTRSTS